MILFECSICTKLGKNYSLVNLRGYRTYVVEILAHIDSESGVRTTINSALGRTRRLSRAKSATYLVSIAPTFCQNDDEYSLAWSLCILVEGVFTLLYKELYYRHIYESSVRVSFYNCECWSSIWLWFYITLLVLQRDSLSIDQRFESYQNYWQIFDLILSKYLSLVRVGALDDLKTFDCK